MRRLKPLHCDTPVRPVRLCAMAATNVLALLLLVPSGLGENATTVYEPYLVEGVPVEVSTTINVAFYLK